MAASAKVLLFQALRKRVGFEVVSEHEAANQLRIVGRIADDALGLNENNWIIVMYRLLTAMEERPWKADLSKWYFKKKETGKVVHARRIILQGENISQHYADITNIIATSPQARVEVNEIPLGDGREQNRNNTAGGKRGAGAMGSVAVGQAAATIRNMGG